MDEDDDIMQFSPVAPIEESRGKSYHFYILGTIGEATQYIRLLHTLKSCGPHDLVYLHINSPGGYLWTAIQLIHAIGVCRGTVITCAEGEVASGASLLFFAGHGMEVGEFASVMAHDARGGHGGPLAEQAQSLDHVRLTYQRLCETIYGPFLSKKELKSVFDGGTVYLDSAEVRKRIDSARKKAKRESK